MHGIDPQLKALLIAVQRRFQSARLAWSLVLFWVAVAIAMQLGWLPQPRWNLNRVFEHRVSIAMASAVGVLLWWMSRRTYRDVGGLAQQIEKQFPSLEQRLLTALESRTRNSSSFLQMRLIDETVQHGQCNDWTETLPKSQSRLAWGIQWIVLGGLVAWGLVGSTIQDRVAPAMVLGGVKEGAGWSIEPGDIELERGSDLLVTARFHDSLPDQAQLVLQAASGEIETVEMTKALSDPLFGATARRVDASMRYSIRTGDRTSESFQVTVFEHPALLQSDATIVSPAFANQATRTIEDTRRVTVVEGSQVTWLCRLNKEVSTAELVDDAGGVTALQRDPSDPLMYRATFELSESTRWELRLADAQSRSSKLQEPLTVRVLENKAPEIKLAGPIDQSVSPLQEVMVTAKVKDDFGLVRTGLSYSLGDGLTEEVTWGEPAGSDAVIGLSEEGSSVELKGQTSRKFEVSHSLDLEAMRAKSDQLLSFYVWTEDIDRDGQVRRTDGELYFAEVRPFEELFREGSADGQSASPSQQQSGSSPAAQQAEDLAELQKKIISGTWNVLRKGNRERDTEALLAERDVLIESQMQALQQSDALRETLQDEKSIPILKSLQKKMQDVIDRLREISDSSSASSGMREALKGEQSVYEGLLRLRAREHSIVQQQQSSQPSSQSASQRNRQQQIDQLKLDETKNRFETESMPEEATEPESEREMRQVMSRLDELARRQEDLNQQVRELDLALREAEAGEQREKLEEELRRLRDQQEEMLRDADELLDRMNNEQVRESMEESRERMEQAREQMQQTNRSLARAEPSPAIASGAKAQEAMEETRDELREKTSEGLRRSMDALRQQATELEQRQSALDRELSEQTHPSGLETEAASTSTLRTASELDSEPRDSKAWQDQQQQLTKLLSQLQETVTESESSEPLLADELYEAFRRAKQQGIEQRMEQIPKFMDRGLEDSAREASSEVLSAIREMKEQIEKSASSVLGSEEQAMQRAIRELDQARAWLEGERRALDPEASAENGQQGRNEAEGGQAEGGEGRSLVDGASPKAEGKDSGDVATREGATTESTSPKDGTQSARSNPASADERERGSRGEEPAGASERSEGRPSGRAEDASGASGEMPTGGRTGQGRSSESPGEARREQPEGRGPRGGIGAQPTGEGSEVGNGRVGERMGMEQLTGESEFVAPLTGEDFSRWSDALRDVEELVRDPEWKAEAARIREAAREMRVEYKRHAKDPKWPLVQRMIVVPMDQLRQKVSEELIRKSAKQNEIVPIDRDPVPNQFQQRLDRYYENLGSGKNR